MSVIYEEQGAEIGAKEQEMTNVVHYVMKYIIKDGNDHCVDALRYSLSPIIKRRNSVLDNI